MSNLTRRALKDILKSGSYLTNHIMPTLHYLPLHYHWRNEGIKLANTPSSVSRKLKFHIFLSLSVRLPGFGIISLEFQWWWMVW